MPNPFPGMDPYLEGDLWTTVHTDLCAEVARQLTPKLRPTPAEATWIEERLRHAGRHKS